MLAVGSYRIEPARGFDREALRQPLAVLAGRRAMFALGAATRIYLAAGATDLRKGFDGLYALVRERLELHPLSGHAFLFARLARTRLRILFRDGSGLWLAREAGFAISRATLHGWVMQVGELLTAVAGAMRQELLAAVYIQADETSVDVQMHDGRGRNGRGWLRQYGHPRGPVVFDFRPGRSRDGPRQFLAGFRGIFETDGYAACEQSGGPEIVLAACWAHVRRKFYEAAKLAPRELLPARIATGMDELLAIDAEARAQGLDLAGRHALRQQRARALLAEVRRRVAQARQETLPASAPGRAVAYALAQWPKLVQFLEFPNLELRNNLAENAIRPVRLGRADRGCLRFRN